VTARRLGLAEAVRKSAEIRTLVSRGGVLGIPTDTRYGLATDPFSARGVARIDELKGRPKEKALPVLVADAVDLARLGVVADRELLARLSSIWPERLTVVLAVADPFAATAGKRSVAVRIPKDEALRELLRAVGPLTATSANRSGEAPAGSADEVERVFGPELDLVVDGGLSPERAVSTLVDATTVPPRVLREGPFVWPASI